MNEVVEHAKGVKDLFDLTGRVAVVTGGGKGLGEAMALALAGAGANVVIVGKTKANNQRVQEEIEEIGSKSITIEIDVRDEKKVKAMVDQVVENFGRFDILINSAGYADVQPIAVFPLETWEYIMDVNVKGSFLCSREAAKIMLKQNYGKIINISSIQSLLGRPGDPAYAASKAAVNLMTKSMASEWGKGGINVNAILPTYFWTEMTKSILENETFYKHLQTRIPMGRAGNKEDLLGITVFLASDASNFVNGALLVIDGGASASDGFPAV